MDNFVEVYFEIGLFAVTTIFGFPLAEGARFENISMGVFNVFCRPQQDSVAWWRGREGARFENNAWQLFLFGRSKLVWRGSVGEKARDSKTMHGQRFLVGRRKLVWRGSVGERARDSKTMHGQLFLFGRSKLVWRGSVGEKARDSKTVRGLRFFGRPQQVSVAW